ncbi:MAG: SurA N-terminal domain-containing protein [Gemmatimonadales bacterium]
MMQFFRNSAGLVAGVFVVLMLIFVAQSVDWNQIKGGGRSSIGSVNGQAINSKNYQAMVQQAIDQQRGTNLGAEEVQQIRNYVWDQVVQDAVLNSEYKRFGITASPDEIKELMLADPLPAFQQSPDFQTEGKFDIQKYQRWLQSPIAQPYLPSLQAQYADEVMRSKLFRVVTADTYLSDAAAWRKFRDQTQTARIVLAAIIANNAVKDSGIIVSNEEIDTYYKAHPKEFDRPRTAYLSYVFFSRLPDASDTAAAVDRAGTLRKEIAGGAPFAEVAKRESGDSVSAAKGGDMGEWKKGGQEPAVDKAAFSLPLHTVSAPLLGAEGVYLIEVTARSGDKVTTREIYVPIEVQGSHRDALDAMADSLERLGAERLDPAALDTAARALGLKVGRTNPVQEGSRVQIGVQVVPDAGIWAFEAKPGETGRIIEAAYGYFLFRLDSVQAAGVAPLSVVRQGVIYSVQQEKKQKLAVELAQRLHDEAVKIGSLATAATSMKLPNQVVGPFTRTRPPIPSPEMIGAAFGLDSGQISPVLDSKEGLYVIQSLGHTKPDTAAFLAGLEQSRAEDIRAARQERVRNYTTALRESAVITDRRAQLFQTQAQADAAASRAANNQRNY